MDDISFGQLDDFMVMEGPAKHNIASHFHLGHAIDVESGPQPDPNALGDDEDAQGDDEDGWIDFSQTLAEGTNTITVFASAVGYLNGIPLVSLNVIYEIPLLMVASWRGEGGKDAPEHLVMGDIMTRYFDLLDLPWHILSSNSIREDIASITQRIAERKVPGALIVSKGLLDASG